MSISLTKGGNVSLTKEAPNLKSLTAGLGWDTRTTDGADFDLDVSIFMVNEADLVLTDQHFIFFNNLKSPCGSVTHLGDNLTGEGDGDDEQVNVKLDMIPSDVNKLVFAVTIHEADQRKQNFGQVSNAFIRLVNADTNEETARYDLSEDASTETAMIFAELYRRNDEWKFKAVGQGFAGGLAKLAQQHNVNI